MAKINEEIFRAYDVRGIYPAEINEEAAYLIGKAYASYLRAKKVIVGRDIRQSSYSMEKELIRGLKESGVNIIKIGQISTEMLYFAVSYLKAEGGIAVTASHNPKEFAGFKFVREKSIPITGNDGLPAMLRIIKKEKFIAGKREGKVQTKSINQSYQKKSLFFY